MLSNKISKTLYLLGFNKLQDWGLVLWHAGYSCCLWHWHPSQIGTGGNRTAPPLIQLPVKVPERAAEDAPSLSTYTQEEAPGSLLWTSPAMAMRPCGE